MCNFRQGYIEHGRREPARYAIGQPEKVVGIVQSIPHVQAVMTRLNFSV